MRWCLLCILVVVCAQAGYLLASPNADTPIQIAGPVDFARDIRPILANHCYACHGPDDGQRKAHLRFDRREEAFKARKGGSPLVPGSPEHSPVWLRVSAEDEAVRMPPAEFGKPLKPEQIELLRRWIAEGAVWRDHWSYNDPKRPPLPVVRNYRWPRNGLDYFILERLEHDGLQPAPEASKSSLLRRVTLDLIGLPPTPTEQEAFLKDERPDAYERVVDRLLASPHFGERWAVHWLDLARYADTNGYHIDNHRDMWLWRDWVIRSLNANMPFDQFTVEQLAGDLLPNATVEQKIGSGFHRNVMVNFEGGADPNEYLTKYIVDRVNTTGTVWLGSTLACAECHDHKYDPFTQKDFYQFYAYFHNVPEQGLDGQKDNPKPSLKVPSPQQEKRRQDLAAALGKTDEKIRAALAQFTPPVATPESRPERTEFIWADDDTPPGATAAGDEGGWKWSTQPTEPIASGRRSSARTATGRSQHYFENAPAPVRVGQGDQFFAYVFLDPDNPPHEIMLQFNDGTWEHRVYWGDNKIEWGQEQTPSRVHAGALPPTSRWVRLSVSAQVVGLPAGSLVNGMAFTQFGGTVHWDRAGIVSTFPQAQAGFARFADWQRWEKQSRKSTLPPPLLQAMRKNADKRSADEQHGLWSYYVSRVDPVTRPQFEPMTREQETLQKQRSELDAAIPSTMVMEELATPRETHLLVRGNFMQKGVSVAAAVPAFLPQPPAGLKADRLALARWLVSPDHPLTSRVTVNRYWEQIFGAGLVRTTEDFGSQGEWPSHPELLDWLAVEFRTPSPGPLGCGGSRGWDIKALLRMLVTSATYRQSTRMTPELAAIDPLNRLLARGPRFRLPAELVRDQALAVSGLMNARIGGPSVRPYQPPGLWEQLAFGGGFSAQTYEQSHGPDLYRRGLYVYGKRSLPHPSLFVFDAPNREVCCDRRPRTNTPLQALTLMNDPIFVEAARKLGERVVKEGGATTESRVDFAFRLCLGRSPTRTEGERLAQLYERLRQRYEHEPEAAKQLLGVGEAPPDSALNPAELAAWAGIGNVLLNLDEMLTKG